MSEGNTNARDQPGPPPEALEAVWLGRLRFDAALDRQLRAREQLIAGTGPPTLFVVEHPPVLTLGRRSSRGDILWSEARLSDHGVEIADAPRGGQVTLHAPGQLVAYPVVRVGRQIRAHVERLAEVSIELLAELGVSGLAYRAEHPGVWLGPRKLASIGIHVSRGVTVQGIAINLDVDPALFGALVSCGLPDAEVTSVTHVGGRPTTVEAAARRWAELYAQAIGAPLRWA